MAQKPYKLTIRKNARQEFWWNIRARNGNIIHGATEGYDRYREVKTNLGVEVMAKFGAPDNWKHGARRMTVVVGGRPQWE